VRSVYVIAGIILLVLGIFNVPRLPWITAEQFGPAGIFRGFEHGAVGLSYQAAWGLLIGGVYQLILGVMYWDMDLQETERWQLKLDTGGTARLLWISGAITLVLGIIWGVYIYTHDSQLWPCGLVSSAWAILTCYVTWLGFPLMEQVGFDQNMLEK
jgi:hypothetical protein